MQKETALGKEDKLKALTMYVLFRDSELTVEKGPLIKPQDQKKVLCAETF